MADSAVHTFVVVESDAGTRLDRFLAKQGLAHTRSQLKRQIDRGACLVNDRPGRPSTRLRPGDELRYQPPPPEPERALPEQIPLEILFEDEHLLVLNKVAGMVVHPAAGHPGGTLVNALLGHGAKLADVGDPFRPGIVHRLDRLTSGVMVASKTEQARASLSGQFAVHSVERRYRLLVVGNMLTERGTFDTLHGRHPTQRKRFSSRVQRGRRAVTHYRVERHLNGVTQVQARLETGRTHQVRVHFADRGWPLLGDPMYGRAPADLTVRQAGKELARQALHARVLAFDHPHSGARLRFDVPPPSDMQEAVRKLSK